MALSCRDCTSSSGGARVLDGVDLDVARGGWLSLVGPNGAGKTTLLRVVCGLVEAAGTLRLDGGIATSLSRRERARLLALVPQAPVVPPGIGVAD